MASRGPLAPDDVRAQVARGEPSPIYLFLGRDEREKVDLATVVASLVEEEVRAFNVDRFHGGETSVAAVIDAARTLPLMARHRVVIVQQAEPLLQPRRDDSEEADREAAELEAYLKSPFPHAVLVLLASELDGRRRLVKLLVSRGSVVDCGVPGTADEGAAWVRRRAAEAGVALAEEALSLLLDRVGRDVGRLRADTERLLLFAAGKRLVSVSDVEATVGEAVLQDEWAMVRAIEQGETAAALRELALKLEASPVPPRESASMILGQRRWMVTAPLPRGRFPRDRAKPAVEAIFQTDLALKTSGGDARILLERLVVELCGGGKAGPARHGGSQARRYA
jgi:DNA polymerase-3 subunit delta